MARTKIIPSEELLSDLEYTSVIVSYSNGIDSTGALYWAIRHFSKEMIYLLYCDTGCEYPENIALFYKTAKFLNIKPVLLSDPRGFLGLLLHERMKFPDMKRRWCTSYLKTAVTDKWIRQHRELHLPPHPCYEYIGRCSCMFCMFMPDRHAAENIKRYPEIAVEYVRAEIKLKHTWKKTKSLQSLFNECLDIDDIDEDLQEEYKQMSLFDILDE